MNPGDALLLVDVQNDFCPGGALGIPGGDKIIPILNDYIGAFKDKGLLIIASRDWHSAQTQHFKQFGGIWPVHCVQETFGAQFHPDLRLPDTVIVLSKGMDPAKDSYSAFQSLDPENNSLLDRLKKHGVKKLFIGGLATDYCVKFTVLDALNSGFQVAVLMDAIKGVNINSDDSEKAIKDIFDAGADLITFDTLRQ
ncbi:MAG: bifunctional nicotinamidase/pyrazinamidase [Candidatus Omnitrophota bacterium]